MRIASLCPSNTELLCSLNLGAELIAVDNYSDTPTEIVEKLPRLGPDLHIDVPRLVAMSPDLVLSSLSVPGMEKVVAAIEEAGLRQIVLSSETLNGMFEDMATIADVIGRQSVVARAKELISQLQERIHRIETVTQTLNHSPKLYWEWWPKPIFSPAQNNWLTELSALAGGRNLFGHLPGSQVQDDGRRVLAGQPDYVLIVWTGVPQEKVPLEKILNRPEIAGLSAVKKGQLYILSEGMYCRPSPRLVDGLEQLFGLIQPTLARKIGVPAPSEYGPVRDVHGNWL
jgi:iron complex transport system substrate-binding protein